MNAEATAGPKGRLAVGIVFIALGVILTLAHAGLLNIEGVGRWWPLFIIGIGMVKLRQPLEDGQRAVGAALLFAGGWFLIMGVLSWGNAWPLIMVGFGAFLLWQALAPPTPAAPAASRSSFVSELALMGGVKRSIRVADFRGGYITAVMGGCELDLRQSKIGDSPVTLDVVAVWGGIALKVPTDWRVEGRVQAFMGAFEDKSQSLETASPGPRLVMRGYAIMGVVIVAN